MTIYDGVMIGLVVGGMVWGAVRGITWQLASIASLALAYLFSHQISGYIAPYIPGDPAIRRAGSMLASYVAISAGVFFVAWTVRATLKKIKFEAYDRHLGMLLGGLEGALLGIVGTLFVVGLAPESRQPIFASHAGQVVAKLMDAAGPALPEEVRKVVSPYWDRVRNAEDEPAVARDDAPVPATSNRRSSPRTSAKDTPSEGSSLQDLARGARTRIGRAVGDAVKAEIERMGDTDDERRIERR